MELDELKQNWQLMNERLQRLEMENRRLQDKTVGSKLHRLRRRLIPQLALVAIFLPNLFWIVDCHTEGIVTRRTWILLYVFVAVVIARQIVWRRLLNKIDCLRQSVREACLAEIRFRLAFKVGGAASVVAAAPLLANILYNVSQTGNPYMLTGAWTGLAIGLLIGLCIFLRVWRDMKELREAIAELQ